MSNSVFFQVFFLKNAGVLRKLDIFKGLKLVNPHLSCIFCAIGMFKTGCDFGGFNGLHSRFPVFMFCRLDGFVYFCI